MSHRRNMPAGFHAGAVLIAVLVALTVATIIFGTLLKTAAAERAVVRRQQLAMQAEYLAQAALDRAVSRLSVDADYAGETWNLTAAQVGGKNPAAVNIEVESIANEAHRRRVRATADYPPDPVRRARHSRERVIELSRQEALP